MIPETIFQHNPTELPLMETWKYYVYNVMSALQYPDPNKAADTNGIPPLAL